MRVSCVALFPQKTEQIANGLVDDSPVVGFAFPRADRARRNGGTTWSSCIALFNQAGGDPGGSGDFDGLIPSGASLLNGEADEEPDLGFVAWLVLCAICTELPKHLSCRD